MGSAARHPLAEKQGRVWRRSGGPPSRHAVGSGVGSRPTGPPRGRTPWCDVERRAAGGGRRGVDLLCDVDHTLVLSSRFREVMAGLLARPPRQFRYSVAFAANVRQAFRLLRHLLPAIVLQLSFAPRLQGVGIFNTHHLCRDAPGLNGKFTVLSA